MPMMAGHESPELPSGPAPTLGSALTATVGACELVKTQATFSPAARSMLAVPVARLVVVPPDGSEQSMSTRSQPLGLPDCRTLWPPGSKQAVVRPSSLRLKAPSAPMKRKPVPPSGFVSSMIVMQASPGGGGGNVGVGVGGGGVFVGVGEGP